MKRQFMGLATAAAFAIAPLSGIAVAQTAVKAAVTAPFVTQQPANEWLAEMFIGQSVQNKTGETVGEISDLLFDRKGQISTAIIGVGGFLSVGEKYVGVPYGMLTFETGKSGERVILVTLSKQDLTQAPAFTATEKTAYEKVKDKAVVLKDQTVKKIDELRKGETAKK